MHLPVPASASDLERFKSNVTNIVTSKGGEIELTDEQRRHFLIFSNGDFLVSSEFSRTRTLHMLYEVSLRKGISDIKIFEISLKNIRLLYEQSARAETKTQQELMPIEQVVSNLISECCDMNISDLHIKVYDLEADIYIRKDGDMQLLRQIDAGLAHSVLASLYNNASDADATYKINMYQAARIVASKTRFYMPEKIQAIRLQFNPLGQGGRYMIARFLYAEKTSNKTIDPVKFGFHSIHAKSFARMRRLPTGINIVSGPTGSGKSTTLKNLLELLYVERKQKVNIISIEDPPEYEIEGTAQLPVTNVETEQQRGEEYRKAITAALRSDPDIIMPGEARDAEVISLLFTAAMTGHQVWTSLHANNALAIFDRLKDQGVDDFKLTDPELITGLIAQRLVKKLCSECSLSLTDYLDSGGLLSEDEKMVIEGYSENVRFANTCGCSSCKSGYKGRTIIAEVIEPDSHLLKLIAEGKRQEAVLYWLCERKGMSMKEHAWIKVLHGDIAVADAMDRIAGMTDITQERKRFLFSLGR
ncbi:nucleotide binding protein [Escherichia coli]|uniref:GspE/PulE family protein n=1 Tax=Escherichia coli TaxID=562 RepID=UPI001919A9EF|nr:ATPase, T2SS/T4P/T4SS family [Escherichia coli]CAD6176222.1 nucleotide binding protein [Escherichia coli]